MRNSRVLFVITLLIIFTALSTSIAAQSRDTLHRSAPTSANVTKTILEDSVWTFSESDFPFNDSDGNEFLAVRLTSIPDHGTITYMGFTIGAGSVPYPVDVPALNLLKYTPEINGNGTAYSSFNFQVMDSATEFSGEYQFTFNVTAVNDDPQLFMDGTEITGTIDLNITVFEDGFYTFTPADSIRIDDVDILNKDDIDTPVILNMMTSYCTLTIDRGMSRFISGNGTSNVTIVSTINQINDYLDSFTLHPNQNVSGPDTLVIRINDQGNTGQGGGNDVYRNLSFYIEPVNDAPILYPSYNAVLTSIPEDDYDNPGNLIENIVENGAIYDPDGNTVKAIAVIEVDNTYGNWQYSTNNGITWDDFTAIDNDLVDISSAAPLLDGTLGTHRIRFVPMVNYNGYANLRFRAWDRSAGNAGQTYNVVAVGDTTAFSVASDIAQIKVQDINDTPELFHGSTKVDSCLYVPLDVDENLNYHFTAADSIRVWDPDIASNQLILNISVTKGILSVDGGSRFISGDGTNNVVIVVSQTNMNNYLKDFYYYSDPDVEGMETMTVIMNDQGFTGQGTGVNIERKLYFALTNDPPVFTSEPPLTVNEDELYQYNVTAIDDTISVCGLHYASPTLPAWLSLTDHGDGTATLSGYPTNEYIGLNEVAITIRDDIADPVPQTFNIEVINVNDPPEVLNPIGNVNVNEDTLLDYVFPENTFFDPDPNESLSYSAEQSDGSELPAWLNFVPLSRRFTGTPANEDIAVYSIALTATDLSAETVIDTFTITVINTNDAPYVLNEIPDQITQEQDLYQYTVPDTIFADDDPGDNLTYSATLSDLSPLPAWLSFDPGTRTFSGTPVHVNIGQIFIRVEAEDISGQAASDVFRLWVTWINIAPFVATPLDDQNATEDSGFSFAIPDGTFDDENIAEGDILTYSARQANDSPLPNWLNFDPNTKTFTGIPRNENVGTLSVKAIVTDVPGLTAEDVFDINIANTNDPPYVLNPIPNQLANEDQLFEFTFSDSVFGDPDTPYGDTFTYSAVQDSSGREIPLPLWLSFDSNTRTFSGTPTNDDRGIHRIKVIIEDAAGLTASVVFQIEVLNSNDGPVVLNPILDHHATEDLPYTFTFSANVFSDPDNQPVRDILLYSAGMVDSTDTIVDLPSWMNFTPELRTFNGIPLNEDVGIYQIAVTATDTAFATAVDTFRLEVENVNDIPVLANPIEDQVTTEADAYSFTFPENTFTDDDIIHGDYLTYTARKYVDGDLQNLPTWLSFNQATRTFSGTPQASDIEIFEIQVTATDSSNTSATDLFQFEVRYLNQPPVLANPIPNQNGLEDTPFTFTFNSDTFFDANVGVGDTLFYSATLVSDAPLPGWLTFTPASRNFSGTATNAEVGTYDIRVTARDRSDESVSDEFAIVIANTNDAPYIANPIPNQIATEDQAFSYTIPANTFEDDDIIWGDALILSASLEDDSPLPAWLAFDDETETFSGTPTVPENIQVKVTATDNQSESVSSVFTIEIQNTQDDPYFISSPVLQGTEDSPYTYNITVADDDPDAILAIDATVLPGWLTLDDNGDNTGVLQGTPLNANVGENQVALTVSDGVRVISTQEFTIQVANVNDAPVVANPIPNRTVAANTTIDYYLADDAFVDDDIIWGDELTYSAALSDGNPLAAWIAFNAESKYFTFQPALDDVDTYEIRVTVRDNSNEEAFDDFILTVIPTNQQPQFTSTPSEDATEDVLYTYNITSSDDGIDDGFTIAGTTVPEWLTLTDNGDGTALLEGTPGNDNVGENPVILTLSDNIAQEVSQEFSILVANVNNAPQVVNPIADQTATQDVYFQFSFTEDVFEDIDAVDALTYSAKLADASPLPAWLSFEPGTRTFTGTPANSNVGEYSIAVIATDIEGATGTDIFTLTVENVNDGPYLLHPISMVIGWEDVLFNYTFPSNTFTDPDIPYGDILTYSATLSDGNPLPEWLTFTSSQRLFSGLPSDYDTGTYSIRLTATDIAGESVYNDFNLVINNFNDSPELVNPIPDQAAFTDTPFEYIFPEDTFNDPDPGDFMNYTATLEGGSPLPAWMSFDGSDRRFYGTPAGIESGTSYPILLTASDAALESAEDHFNIVVFASNFAPEFTSTPVTDATQDIPYIYNITVEDDGVNFGLTLEAPELPEWLTFSNLGNGNASLTGTPTNDEIGTFDVRLTAWDHIADPVEQSFTIEVQNVNDAPVLVNPIADQISRVDIAYSYTIPEGTFNDIDTGDALTYSASLTGELPLPGWLSFDAPTVTFSGTPAVEDIGQYDIVVKATDIEGAFATDEFVLEIVPSNYPPEFTSSPLLSTFEDALYLYNVKTSDDGVNEGGIVLQAPVIPEWLTLNDNGDGTADLTGTPDNSMIGVWDVTLTLSDGISPAVEQSFAVTVVNTNDGPVVVNPIPNHVTYESAAYSFTFDEDTFTDDDIIYGDQLTYVAELSNGDPLPGWLSFIPSQRTFSGIPMNNHVGTYTIRVIASDIAGLTATDEFQLQVLNVNTPPYVENPLMDQAAIANTLYNFTIPETTFGDDDLPFGDILTYAARQTNGDALPTWLTFDPETHTFNGVAPLELIGTTYDIRVFVRDTQLESVSDDFSLAVIESNDPPVFTSTPVTTATEDVLYSYLVTASDDGQNFGLAFLAVEIPEWLSLVNHGDGTATLSGTPDNENVGSNNLDIVVSDGIADPVHQIFSISVTNVNGAPYVANPIPDQTATEDEFFTYTFADNTFDDEDLVWGDELSYSTKLSDNSPLPAWLSFNDVTRTFSGTPGDLDVVDLDIVVIATDIESAFAEDTFHLEVINNGDSPYFTSSPVTNATEDFLYQYNIVTEDTDPGALLVISAPQAPSWLTLTDHGDGTALLEGTPLNENVGAHNVVLTVNDGTRVLGTQAFTINVTNTNDLPYVNQPIPDQAILINEEFAYVFPENTFADDDTIYGDALVYAAMLTDGNPLPAWLSFNPNARYFNGLPGLTEVGSYSIRVVANDQQAGTVWDDFILQVIETNVAPSFTSLPVTTATEDVLYQYNVTTADDGVNMGITISAPQVPAWLAITDNGDGTATLFGTPANEDVGTHNVVLNVSDGIAAPVAQLFSIVVENVNTPPVLVNSIPDQAALVGQAFNYSIPENTFADFDADDVLTYEAIITSGGSWTHTWLIFYPAQRRFYGLPSAVDIGSYTIRVTVTDTGMESAFDIFTLSVYAEDVPPVFTSLPITQAYENIEYTYNVTTTDDGIDLGITIEAPTLPSWLTFTDNEDGTGLLRGTPTTSDIGTHDVVLTVTDNILPSIDQSFSIEVLDVNQPPVLVNPIPNQTTVAEQLYQYTVPENTFEDPDEASVLTWNAMLANGEPLPEWLTFNPETRVIQGTPAVADAGTHNIMIIVTDDGGMMADDDYLLRIFAENQPPVFTSSPVTEINVDELYLYNITTSDDVNNFGGLVITAETVPSWLALYDNEDGTATLTGTPTDEFVGSNGVVLSVSDGISAPVEQAFDINVSAINHPPYVANPLIDQVAVAGSFFSYTFADDTFVDPDQGDVLSYEITTVDDSPMPVWLLIDEAGRTLSGTPQLVDTGIIPIRVKATDIQGEEANDEFNLRVIGSNDAPEFTSTPVTNATQDSRYTYEISATDDAYSLDGLVFSTNALPEWLTFNDLGNGMAVLAGIPSNADVGQSEITILVSDGLASQVEQTFQLTVHNINDAPIVVNPNPDQRAVIGQFYQYQANLDTFDDPDIPYGDHLTYTSKLIDGSNLPRWLVFDPVSMLYRGSPSILDARLFSILLIATDDSLATAVDQFDIVVRAGNEAPEFASVPPTEILQGETYSYDIVTTDDNNNAGLTIIGGVVPEWLALVDNGDGTGVLSGVPGNDNVGAHEVVLYVSDGIIRDATSQQFTITVHNMNDAPYIANPIPDMTTTAGELYDYTIPGGTFADPDIMYGDHLAYDATLETGSPLPEWLTFNAETLAFSGTPQIGNSGNYSIKVTVTDDSLASVSDVFVLEVYYGNLPPQFTSTPVTEVNEDATYLYNITTMDDGVGFGVHITATALPGWLTLTDNGDGTAVLAGVPKNGDVGEHEIVLQANDNVRVIEEQSFTITVYNTNDAPYLIEPISDVGIRQGIALNYEIPSGTFGDDDLIWGDEIVWSAKLADGSFLPAWLDFDIDTHTFSGTPDIMDVGIYDMRVTVTDLMNASAFDDFVLTVYGNNVPPVFVSVPDTTATEDVHYSYEIETQDDGYNEFINITAVQIPGWLTLTDNGDGTGLLAGTPTNDAVGSSEIILRVDDGIRQSTDQAFTLTVINVNDAPYVANQIPDRGAVIEMLFEYAVPENTFADDDIIHGDVLTYSADQADGSALPAWLAFNPVTKTFSGTASLSDIGIYNIRVTVMDTSFRTASDIFIIRVVHENDGPVFTSMPELTADEGTLYSYSITVTDDGTNLGINISAPVLPDWLSLVDNGDGTATLSGIPTWQYIGANPVTLNAEDGIEPIPTEQSFSIEVRDVNTPPYVQNPIPDQNAVQDAAFFYTIPEDTFGDLDADDILTYSAIISGNGPLPEWLSFDEETRAFSGTPTNDNVGSMMVDVTAMDMAGQTAISTFTLFVVNVNDAPYVTHLIPDHEIVELTSYSFTFRADTFSDPDIQWGDFLTYTAKLTDGSPLPEWLEFTPETRSFNGIPTHEDVGHYSIRVTATDSEGLAVFDDFILQVLDDPDAPFVVNPIPDQSAWEEVAFSYTFPENTFGDADYDNTLYYEATLSNGDALPEWLSFDDFARTFNGMPAQEDVGSYSIKVTATDIYLLSASDIFIITVYNANDLPYFTSVPDTIAQEASPYLYNIVTEDVDAMDSWTLTAPTLPSWLTLTDNGDGTGSLSGMPYQANIGDNPVVITVVDSTNIPVDQIFTIYVQNVVEPPVVSNPIPDQETYINILYDYTFPANTFTEPTPGDALTYTATLSDDSPLPAWLAFDAVTRNFSGTPSDLGTYQIKVTATDMDMQSVSDEYTLDVVFIQLPPAFTSTPVTDAIEDAIYTYNITASDINGESLVFAEVNVPSWLALTDNGDSTATLSGTPLNANVGENPVEISVTDNNNDPVIQSFTITVANTNDAPVYTNAVPNQIAPEDALFEYIVPENTFEDDDLIYGDVLTYSSTLEDGTPLPAWLAFDPVTRTYSGTPLSEDIGIINVKIVATDIAMETAEGVFQIEITNTNDAPYVMNPIADQAATEDTPFSFTFADDTFGDDDIVYGDMLSYTSALQDGSPLPAWLTFDSATRTYSGTPANEDNGTWFIRLTATDNGDLTAFDDFEIVVSNAQDDPYFTSTPVTTATEDVEYTYNITATDDDPGATLVLGADVLPAWLTLTDNGDGTGNIAGTPLNEHVGTNAVTLTVSDGVRVVAYQTFDIEVANTNDAPYVINPIPDQAATEDTPFSFTFADDTFGDDDIVYGDMLSYTSALQDGSPLPAWLTFDSATRTYSGTPANEDNGTWFIRLTATDNGDLTAFDDFEIVVSNAQDDPYFTSTPVTTATEDVEYTYNITATDDDPGATLVLGADVLPAWLTLTDNGDGTGNIAGTPLNEHVGTNAVTLTVSDGVRVVAYQTFDIEVANTNDAPYVMNPIPDQAATEDTPFSFTFANDTFGDDDIVYGDMLSYTSALQDGSPLPAWLAFDSATRTYSGTPANEDNGTWFIRLTATDNGDLTAFDDFEIVVSNTQDDPYFTSTPVTTATEDVEYTYNITATDNDPGATLVLGADVLPAWLTLTDNGDGTGNIAGTPLNEHVGTNAVTLTVSDGVRVVAYQTFDIEVTNTNDAPYVMNPIADQAATEDTPFSFTFADDTFGDDDIVYGDMLSYTSALQDGSPLPAWLTFDSATRTYSGTPANEDNGTWFIRLTATDNGDLTAFDDFEIVVSNTQDDPYFTSTPVTTATEDVEYTYNITATDDDPGATLVLGADVLPAWLTLTDNGDGTGNIAGTPLNEHVGTNAVTLTVSDGVRVVAYQTFDIEVTNTNDAPYVMNPIADQTTDEDEAYSYTFPENTFDDDDLIHGDELTYSALLEGGNPLPAWLTFNDVSRTFSGTPTNDDLGQYSIEVTATDNLSESVSDIFVLTVDNTNDAPEFTSTPVTTATEDVEYTYDITATDDDPNDDLSIIATTLPLWLTLTDNGDGTGNITGTPLNENVGDNAVVLEVHDGTTLDIQSFTIVVANVNDAPVVLNPIPDQTTDEDEAYSYAFPENTFDDDDLIHGDVLTYTAGEVDEDGLPAWLSFDGATRTFSGTPTNDDIGTYMIMVTATDEDGASVNDIFEIEVLNTNDAPYFTSDPILAVNEDEQYSYSVICNDDDPNPVLTITMQSGPEWLTLTQTDNFNATLEGTPTNDNVGDNEVVLVVDDGIDRKTIKKTMNLRDTAQQPFTIVVANVNDAPYVAVVVDSLTIPENAIDTSLDMNAMFGDDDLIHGDALTFSYSGNSHIMVGIQDGVVSLDPETDWYGVETITFYAEDNDGEVAQQSVVITVENIIDVPVIDPIDDQVVYLIDTAWEYQVTAYIYPTATFSLMNAPEGMTIDPATGLMSWTPSATQTDVYNITVHLENNTGMDDEEFTFTVINRNDAPQNLIPTLFNDGTSELTWSAPVSAKWLTGYNVYRSGDYDDNYELIGEVDGNVTHFTDDEPNVGVQNCYRVTAVLEADHIDWQGESYASEVATVYPLPPTEFALYYDDGIPEQGYLFGNEFGVQFDLSPIQRYTPTSTLIRFAIYLYTLDVQDLLINIYGNGDTPSADNFIQTFNYDVNDLHLGWNILDIPSGADLEFVGERFHIVVDASHPYQVGFDTSDPVSGHSYVEAGSGWGVIPNGDLLIRAIVATPLPNIAVDMTSMNFGDVYAGEDSAPQMFTITNTGNYELEVTEIGAPPGFQIRHGTDGGWVETLSMTIPYQGSEDIYARFSPSTRKVYTGEIEIVHNGVDETDVNISVRGNSIEPQPNAFTPNGDGLNDIYTVRLVNSGNVEAKMNIYDLHGKRVREVNGTYDGTGMTLSWDGKDDGGRKCGSGPYIYVLRKNGSIDKRGKIYLVR